MTTDDENQFIPEHLSLKTIRSLLPWIEDDSLTTNVMLILRLSLSAALCSNLINFFVPELLPNSTFLFQVPQPVLRCLPP